MPAVEFETVIPAIKRLQTYTVSRTAAGIGDLSGCTVISTLSDKWHDYKMSVLILYTIIAGNISNSKKK